MLECFFALAQRRHRDWKNIQPIIEIAAEFSLFDHLRQVAICGRDKANIDVQCLVFAKPLKLPVLQDTEKLGLKFQR